MTGFGHACGQGIVSTAGSVVFTGDDDGHLVALDAKNGKELWFFNMGETADGTLRSPTKRTA